MNPAIQKFITAYGIAYVLVSLVWLGGPLAVSILTRLAGPDWFIEYDRPMIVFGLIIQMITVWPVAGQLIKLQNAQKGGISNETASSTT